MKLNETKESQQESLPGVLYGSSAFLIWGLSPIYWKVLHNIPAFEIIMHRVIWSFLFLLIMLVFQRHGNQFMAAVKNRRTLLTLLSTAILIILNWFIYIWAVNNDHVLQASLGYFINPLLNVILGVVFLREQLRPLQTVSLVLAGIGVLYLTFHYGEFPWIALSLAFAFGFYGLLRKVATVNSMVGLTVEMFFLSIPAVAYIVFLDCKETGALFQQGLKIDLFLMGTVFVTAFPLLLFTMGTRRLNLSTVGFLQYIAPSCMFLLGAFLYNETLATAQIFTFVLIWIALLIYSTDSVLYYRLSYPRDSGLPIKCN